MTERSGDKAPRLLEGLRELEKIALIDKPLIRAAIERIEQLEAARPSLAAPKMPPRLATSKEIWETLRGLQAGEAITIGRWAAGDIAETIRYYEELTALSPLAAPSYDAIADAVNEVAEAAQEAFRKVGLEPGEWDSDNIVQDVKRGIATDIERLGNTVTECRTLVRSTPAPKIDLTDTRNIFQREAQSATLTPEAQWWNFAIGAGMIRDGADGVAWIKSHFGTTDDRGNR